MHPPLIKLGLPVLLAASITCNAEPRVALTSTYYVDDVAQDQAGHTLVTLSVTLHNNGAESLNDVTLSTLPGIPVGVLKDQKSPPIRMLDAGSDASVFWTLELQGPVDANAPIAESWMFNGKATDSSGQSQSFALTSREEAR